MIAMTSIEKAFQIQENINKENIRQMNQQIDFINKVNQEILNSGVLSLFQPFPSPSATTATPTIPTSLPLATNSFFMKYLSTLIEDSLRNPSNTSILNEKYLTKAQVEHLLQSTTEYQLKQLGIQQETLRLELSSIQREESELMKVTIIKKQQEDHQALQELL